MMKRILSPHSFIKDRLNRWKRELMERTVVKQRQPGTMIKTLRSRLMTPLILRLMTALIGGRQQNTRQLRLHKCVDHQVSEPLQNQIEENKDNETRTIGERSAGPAAARSSDPERHLQSETEIKTEDFSEPETEDTCYWKETREHPYLLPSAKFKKNCLINPVH
ncbi:uncharacterized protein LOC121523964 isoform X2 [Cheilinus undulatus]|uniref:uncharacterized protein LOC121523964 isoform X2 n=1 Tax=Cheilinus undulatus TaxID=241271 RepID=UPI001BD686CE|nr:uncharacterized protein LOC121523964 isoform X2 [Cheilinus undulatus]